MKQARGERKDPRLLLDRVEARLAAILRELETRPAYHWGKLEPGGFESHAAEFRLNAARKALALGDDKAACSEMLYLGQELMKLEALIATNVGQRRKAMGRQGKEIQLTRLMRRLYDAGYSTTEEMVAALNNEDIAQDAAQWRGDPIAYEARESGGKEEVRYAIGGREGAISRRTIANKLARFRRKQ